MDDQDEALLDPAERATLAEQLRRLNVNIERQFDVIEVQRKAEARAARRRWLVTMVVAALIVGGNVRVEQVRREQDRNRCRQANESRAEIRTAFDRTFVVVTKAAPAESKRAARAVGDDVHEQLADALHPSDC